MSCLFRIGIPTYRTGITGLCKVPCTNTLQNIQIACISTREVRKNRPPRPAPFPYTKKSYNLWHQMFDNTIFRFDDNTKLIVVEGPPAIGKGEICRKLAHELDMLYVPQTTLEDFFVRMYDFDLRTIDDKLPKSCRSVDLPRFFNEPTQLHGGTVQLMFYRLRFLKFVQILGHILSTGQGVITERSPWSDQCFAKTMHSNGYLSDNAYKTYKRVVDESLHELMRPHLIIYLDAPVKTIQEKIKKRNHPGEATTKVLSEKFLTDLENEQKYNYLKTMNTFANILIYDYSDGGDFEVIVEDIEALNFDEKEYNSKKFLDWDLKTIVQWTDKRRDYTDFAGLMQNYIRIDDFSASELIIPAGDGYRRYEAYKKYAPRAVWDSDYFPIGDKKMKWLEPVEG